jgi:hypothetical protein
MRAPEFAAVGARAMHDAKLCEWGAEAGFRHVERGTVEYTAWCTVNWPLFTGDLGHEFWSDRTDRVRSM